MRRLTSGVRSTVKLKFDPHEGEEEEEDEDQVAEGDCRVGRVRLCLSSWYCRLRGRNPAIVRARV